MQSVAKRVLVVTAMLLLKHEMKQRVELNPTIIQGPVDPRHKRPSHVAALPPFHHLLLLQSYLYHPSRIHRMKTAYCLSKYHDRQQL